MFAMIQYSINKGTSIRALVKFYFTEMILGYQN